MSKELTFYPCCYRQSISTPSLLNQMYTHEITFISLFVKEKIIGVQQMVNQNVYYTIVTKVFQSDLILTDKTINR